MNFKHTKITEVRKGRITKIRLEAEDGWWITDWWEGDIFPYIVPRTEIDKDEIQRYYEITDAQRATIMDKVRTQERMDWSKRPKFTP